MLSQLYIENIAVIEKTAVDFESGLNVLTGETGAGKSILIDSIHAILGERISKDLVRTGAKSAFVSATFRAIGKKAQNRLEEAGFPPEEDGSLLIQREIHTGGKTVCRINGRPAPVSILKEIGTMLIHIHGQHENYGLLAPDQHIGYLDRMGGLDNLLQKYRSVYSEMRRIRKELEGLRMDEAQKARQIDLLSYQINELSAAELRIGEQEELSHKQAVFRNSEKIAIALESARSALDGGEDVPGASAAVSGAAEALGGAEQYLPGARELTNRMREIAYDLEDCCEEMRGLSAQLEFDLEEMERIEARLDLLYRLGLKYGGSEEEMLTFLQRCQNELEQITCSDETAARLEAEYMKLSAQAQEFAETLSKKRASVARSFESRVKDELRFLDMPNLVFVVSQERGQLGVSGLDSIQFLISANPGEPARPISKIASGGELSRLMLAIKTVLAGADEMDSMIFDEIDTGISGSAAQKVGLKLHQVSKSRQVICVTHLAQIGALADHHFLIQKHVENEKTFTNVQRLDFEGRKRELARITGGARITELTLQNAEEMLRLAGSSEDSLQKA